MKTFETMDRAYLEYSQITGARTGREIALQARVDELVNRLEDAEAKFVTSDTEKLRILRADLATIVERGARANRGQVVKWVKAAREASK